MRNNNKFKWNSMRKDRHSYASCKYATVHQWNVLWQLCTCHFVWYFGIDDVINAKQTSKNAINSNSKDTKLKETEMKKTLINVAWETHPNTTQNGKISNRTDALIGRCFSSRVIASDAKVNARLSKVNWNVTCTVSKRISSLINSITYGFWPKKSTINHLKLITW